MIKVDFTAPPTCARFMKSESFVRIIAGPVGSGKTTSTIMELLRRSMQQAPAPDGLRYTRFAIVRQTLKQLKDTVLKDILAWLEGLCHYKVQDQTIFIEFHDVRSEWLLIPLDDPDDQRRLLSMQLTGAWLSEAIEMSTEIISPLMGRLGRYPSAKRGNPTWFGIIADTNMPTRGSEWHKLMDVDTPPNWGIFIQPGGLTPYAENLNYLTQTNETIKLPLDHPVRLAQGRRYYETQALGRSPAWIERYINAQYGDDPSGSAVFGSSFTRSFHVIDEGIRPAPGAPLIIGQDFGRNPCCVIGQLDAIGRVLILDEIVAEDIGLELHLTRNLKPLMSSTRYLGMSMYVVGDPAGNQRSTSYEETSFDLVKRAGFNAYPAPTNKIDTRLRAVEAYLLSQRNGGPALMIDGQRCPQLVRSLQGGYRYARRRNGQLAPLPEKSHPHSDVVDALQYLCLAAHGGLSEYVGRRMNNMARERRPTPPASAWT